MTEIHRSTPVVWALLGPKHGDNAQVRVLAQALDPRYTAVPLRYNGRYRWPSRLLEPTLASVENPEDIPGPPWPDVVIGVGRRSVPVARWIRKRSGGHSRLVRIGRPRAPLSWFDLVLTTPQYGLPAAPNVLSLPLPLSPPLQATAEAAAWAERLADRPRPWVGVLVGGSNRSLTLTVETVERMLAAAWEAKGTLLVTTSPRTPPEVLRALDGLVSAPDVLHGWRPDRRDGFYPSLLALADRFVVSGDSVSMLAEAAGTGRPLLVVPACLRRRWQAPWHGLLSNSPVLTSPPDIDALIHHLEITGLATRREDGLLRIDAGAYRPEETLARVAARVRALLPG